MEDLREYDDSKKVLQDPASFSNLLYDMAASISKSTKEEGKKELLKSNY